MFTTAANLFTAAGRVSPASRALLHNSQSGMCALAGIMVAGTFEQSNVPPKSSESPGLAVGERSNERTYSWMHR